MSMFLSQKEQPSSEQSQIVILESEPNTLLRLKNVNRLSIAGFWFLLGVAIANISRIISSGWILYLVFQLGVIGCLVFVQPDNVDESAIATRRIKGLALFLSCAAFWDWYCALMNLPVRILSWIIPVWQCALLGVVVCLLIGIFISLFSS